MLPDPLIIGLAGNAGVGKDAAAVYLQTAHRFEQYAFADPIRDMLGALLERCGIDHTWMTEPALKERPIPGLGASYRALAQLLGTEWARQHLGEDFWLKTASLALGLSSARPGWPGAPIHDRLVISDVRFPNEAHWIVQQGGVVIRIHRETRGVRAHLSETQLHLIQPWAEIDNNGSLQQLYRQLDVLVHRLLGEQDLPLPLPAHLETPHA